MPGFISGLNLPTPPNPPTPGGFIGGIFGNNPPTTGGNTPTGFIGGAIPTIPGGVLPGAPTGTGFIGGGIPTPPTPGGGFIGGGFIGGGVPTPPTPGGGFIGGGFIGGGVPTIPPVAPGGFIGGGFPTMPNRGNVPYHTHNIQTTGPNSPRRRNTTKFTTGTTALGGGYGSIPRPNLTGPSGLPVSPLQAPSAPAMKNFSNASGSCSLWMCDSDY